MTRFARKHREILSFNPHPYVRGDNQTIAIFVTNVSFNPHPYVRGDQKMCP